ncbi:hypothetical protein [Bradyrhizobium sp. RDT46]|uniref:hypothetical protein n=1 Tax=Bradyrhizobium sp. RDT46 TaxID=3341829 RepID=UPI0035C68A24
MNSEPLILVIDDDENEVLPKLPEGFALEVVDPNSEREAFAKSVSEQATEACLIVLDQKFVDNPVSISLDAQDGSSFVSHLRSWSRRANQPLPPIVMFTNDPEVFANEIPAVGPAVPIMGTFVGREHRLAPALDVEWIQFKDGERATENLRDLAEAFLNIADEIGDDGVSLDDLSSALEIPDAVWSDKAIEELQNARPPVNQKENISLDSTRGASQVVRWLCHKALPYPGLFLSDHYAAWALSLSVEDFRRVADQERSGEWLKELDRSEYIGPLDEFMGRRWWRAGIDQMVWLLDEAATSAGSRKAALSLLVPGFEISETKSSSSHVVVCNEDFVGSQIVSIEEAIQVHPPGWPAEALEPWMLRAEVRSDPILKAMADPNDLD